MRGFTLVETVIVIMLVAILSIVAIPQFVDLRQDAKDASTKGAIGGMRSAISLIVGVIALRENPVNNPAAYPTVSELSNNVLTSVAPANHVALNGKSILDKSAGLPVNSWTATATIHDCTGKAKGSILAVPNNNDGWCYDPTDGVLWANSILSTGAVRENNF